MQVLMLASHWMNAFTNSCFLLHVNIPIFSERYNYQKCIHFTLYLISLKERMNFQSNTDGVFSNGTHSMISGLAYLKIGMK